MARDNHHTPELKRGGTIKAEGLQTALRISIFTFFFRTALSVHRRVLFAALRTHLCWLVMEAGNRDDKQLMTTQAHNKMFVPQFRHTSLNGRPHVAGVYGCGRCNSKLPHNT